MEQFKRVKVVMLPTNEAKGDFSEERIYPCLLKYSWVFDKEEKGKLIFADSNIRTPTQLQNLYIISDDEIKLFDWIYNNKENIVEQITSKTQLIFVLEENKENQTFKKIIATTDGSLYREESCTGYTETRSRTFYSKKPLPRPSKQFIEKYIEEYNKGNVITDVLVEYEIQRQCVKCKTIRSHYLCKCGEQDNYENTLQLKINSKDNTITIKKVKDSWNREEVIILLEKALAESKEQYSLLDRVGINKWIEENL